MKYLILSFGILLITVSLSGQNLDKLSPRVQEEVGKALEAKTLPILVRLISPVDLDQLEQHFDRSDISVKERPGIVQRTLQREHGKVQQSVLEQLDQQFPGKYNMKNDFWLVNMLHLEATPDVINYLSQQPKVISIHHLEDYEVVPPQPIEGDRSGRRSPGGIEPGLAAINAPAMWAMGYTGHGQRALIYDTGIEPQHPAVRERFLYHNTFGTEGWFGVDLYYPGDKSSSHGTHVAGIVLGLDPATEDTIGVAHGARFMSTDPIVSDLTKIKGLPVYIQVYEWAFNPDGDTSTTDDIPDVANNSWGLASDDTTLCNSFASDMFNAMEAASIGVIFSAGNNGPDTATTGRPAFINTGLTNVFSVGAVNGNIATYPIANFSSRGPTICPGTGSLKIKPEVSAPGVLVRSAEGPDDYGNKSGTSMAAPHVTGAFLLLKEAFPYLTSRAILEALYFSAVDLGPAGEDNTYGMGIIDVKAAYDTLAKTHIPVPPAPRDKDLAVTEILEPAFTYFCDVNIPVRAVVANTGSDTAWNASVKLMRGNSVLDSLVLPRMDPGVEDTISFQITSGVQGGENEFAVRIDWEPGKMDYDPVDNQRMVRFDFREMLPGGGYRYYDFDTISTLFGKEFFIDGDEDFYTWVVDSTGTDYPGDQAIMIPYSVYLPRNRQRDYIYFPNTQVIPDASLRMTFKHYYKTRNTFFKDSLLVQYSVDCGDKWTTVLEMGDSSMVTTLIDDVSNPDYWRGDTVIVYGLVRIVGVNDYGGDLYLDDIEFMDWGVGIESNVALDLLRIQPNPTRDQVAISWDGGPVGALRVWGLEGRVMYQENVAQSPMQINVSGWPAGVYLIHLQTELGVATRKLVVTK